MGIELDKLEIEWLQMIGRCFDFHGHFLVGYHMQLIPESIVKWKGTIFTLKQLVDIANNKTG